MDEQEKINHLISKHNLKLEGTVLLLGSIMEIVHLAQDLVNKKAKMIEMSVGIAKQKGEAKEITEVTDDTIKRLVETYDMFVIHTVMEKVQQLADIYFTSENSKKLSEISDKVVKEVEEEKNNKTVNKKWWEQIQI